MTLALRRDTATPALLDQATELFDHALARITEGRVHEGMDRLVVGLQQLREASEPDEWRPFAEKTCLEHPIREVVHQDPFVYRAFAKPRGYPGDAGILDLIYGAVPLPLGTTTLGRQIYDYTRSAPACRSVRARRDMLAKQVDMLADTVERPHVLSVACGHLREAQRSAAAGAGLLGGFYALDQDEESLALIDREHTALGVRTVRESVRGLVAGKLVLPPLDLAYAAGLFDYLALPVATAVTRAMLNLVKPGGRVLVANFAPNLRDIGYMESFMAWSLIYRDEGDMSEIAAGLPTELVAATRLFRDAHENIVFLEVTKA
jgi:hypothetical protein